MMRSSIALFDKDTKDMATPIMFEVVNILRNAYGSVIQSLFRCRFQST